MLNYVRHVDSVNSRRMILEMHYAVKRDYRIFEIGKRIILARLKWVTTVEVSLQRVFTIKVIKSLLQR